MLKPLAKKSEKNIVKFRRKLGKRRIFVLKTVPVRPNLGPIWAKRQISQNGTKHLFIALIMLNPLAKKSERNIEKFRRKLSKRRIFVLKTVPVRPNLGPI